MFEQRLHQRFHQRFTNAPGLAVHWGVSRQHIYNLLQKGLPSLKVGRCRRFDIAECDEWARNIEDR